MKGKKMVALGLTAVLTGSMLAGCGSTSGSEGGTEQTAKSDGGTVELELFSSKTENADALQKMIDGFMEQNPDIKITLTSE